MKYILRENEARVISLAIEGAKDATCPHKVSIARPIPAVVEGGPPGVGFVGQGCNTNCPLFELAEDKSKVTIWCGGQPRIINL